MNPGQILGMALILALGGFELFRRENRAGAFRCW
jgi:hypothetical protein